MITNGQSETGRAEKDKALERLATRRAFYVQRGRRALLCALLDRGTVNADDVRRAVELPLDVDPRCLGAVPTPLVRAGIIRRAGFITSGRAERHGSYISQWSLADRNTALDWLAENQELAGARDEQDKAHQLDLFQ